MKLKSVHELKIIMNSKKCSWAYVLQNLKNITIFKNVHELKESSRVKAEKEKKKMEKK